MRREAHGRLPPVHARERAGRDAAPGARGAGRGDHWCGECYCPEIASKTDGSTASSNATGALMRPTSTSRSTERS